MLNLKNFFNNELFIDSNIFIYSATNTGPYLGCEEFLKKIKRGEVVGYVNPIVVNEVYHKLLILEVCKRYNKKPYEAVHFIKDNPQILTELESAKNVIDEILAYRGIKVLEIGLYEVIEARRMFGILLGNDAVHAATCKAFGVSNIATNDADFESVSHLRVWRP